MNLDRQPKSLFQRVMIPMEDLQPTVGDEEEQTAFDDLPNHLEVSSNIDSKAK